MYPSGSEDLVEATNSSTTQTHASISILNSLSLLRNKINQVESLIRIIISTDHQNQQQQQPESTSIAIASIGAIIQEIIVTASSVMFTCQHMFAGGSNSNSNPTPTTHELHQPQLQQLSNYMEQDQREQGFFSGAEMYNWYGDSYNENDRAMNVITTINKMTREEITLSHQGAGIQGNINDGDNNNKSNKNFDIIEFDAAYLLAKYTHYCQVCGKGFKRDANLRMHMRAHGDEYKTSAALSNPLKNSGISTGIFGDNNNNSNKEELSSSSTMKLPRKYSCPQEGCRWNQRHAKFQPLKSMICVKNHYKRSHCPKMYVCKRCNRKQFSVLSDLRTHEKHCGDLKWQCSCGTTFSRKDKLMGHVALFIGHTPAVISFTNPEKRGESSNSAPR